MADLPDKSSAFIDWYLAVVEAAGLSDKRYPVKGMNVWTPYGFLARRQLDRVMSREIEATASRPVEFPTLIPANEFQKEGEHIKGFDAQVFWVTKGGSTELDMPLALRPTSETAIYPVFALWVRSHRDLPLNVYQIVNTFRYETKTTRPFLRVREIHFFEEHTCQVDEAAADARVRSNLEAFAKMAHSLALPFVPVRRPEWDKFPGAYYSVALDIPIGGVRTLQIGSIHHYQENFSKPYGISYETPEGNRKPVQQTTFGLSERLIGALLAVHGDAKGAVFPSEIAPYQIVIVPISGKGADGMDAFIGGLATRLQDRGLRCWVDRSEDRPGAKYYKWETAGVPLRLEIGPRESAAGTVTAVDRLGRKGSIGPTDLEAGIVRKLSEFDEELRKRALATFQQSFATATTLEELRNSKHVRVVPWCGTEACGHAIETAIDGSLLGVPESDLPIAVPAPGLCVACHSTGPTKWALAGQPL
ncbi:MAG: proline--tRNA ligase [Thermoplasmata archaeon]|nr:proline--tRNA ligase [Thermoplasmata archaeon]